MVEGRGWVVATGVERLLWDCERASGVWSREAGWCSARRGKLLLWTVRRLASLAVSLSLLQYNRYDESKAQGRSSIWGTRASTSTKEQCAKDNTFRFALLNSDYKLSMTY